MPPRQKPPEEETDDFDERFDSLTDDEIEELMERRAKSKKSGGPSGDRVTILEGQHARDWLAAFGIGAGDDDGDKRKRPGYFRDR